MTSFAAVSDTHNHSMHKVLEGTSADVLLHAGDALNFGDQREFNKFCRTMSMVRNKFPKGIFYTPGNHDKIVEDFPKSSRKQLEDSGVTLVLHDTVVVDGIKIFMSQYTPRFGNWSFMIPRGNLSMVWKDIPMDTDILVTHGPPFGILDWTEVSYNNAGCEELREFVEKINPKFHIFGHIHEDGGQVVQKEGMRTVFANVAQLAHRSHALRKPFTFEV